MPTTKLYLHNIDLSQNELINGVLHKSATDPANPVDGQLYYNTVDKEIYYYNGAQSSWVSISSQFVETDPIFTAHPAYGITAPQITNWDSAYTWVNAFPAQTGNNGKYLTTNGSALSWQTLDALPSQTGNNGKYLTTNGSVASWNDVLTQVKRNIETFTASANQSLFTTTTPTTGSQIDVYVNGARLSSVEFSVVSANQITLAYGVRAGDIVDIVFMLGATDIPNPGSGSSAPNIIFATTDYTPTATDDAILVNTPLNGNLTVTLPLTTAANQDGYHIKNIGSGTLTVVGTSGQLIDLQSNIVISEGSLSSLYVVPYNNNWYII